MIHPSIYRRALPIIASVLVGAGLLAAAVGFTPLFQHSLAAVSKQGDLAALLDTYGKLPLAFESNQGQTDKSVKFLAHGSGYSLFLTNAGPLLDVGASLGKGCCISSLRDLVASTDGRPGGIARQDELFPGERCTPMADECAELCQGALPECVSRSQSRLLW